MKTWRDEFDVTVLNGLRVTVDVEFSMSDDGHGRTGECIEDWDIVAIGSRAIKNSSSIYRRIMSQDGEEERMIGQVIEILRARKG